MLRASVVLPDPDSPTSATTSPARTTRSAPSSALATRPDRVVNSTRSPRADSSALVALIDAAVVGLADPHAGSSCAALGVRREARARRAGRHRRRAGTAARRSTPGEVARVGRVAREGPTGANRAAGSPTRGNAADSAPAYGWSGCGEDLLGRAFLDHASGVHHGDPVAEVGEHRQVVADHHHPDPALAHQVGQHAEHLRLHHHVEGGGRLVGHDQLGVAGQRHRDHHPLLLAAGQLVRVAAGARGVETDLLEQLGDPARDRLVTESRSVQRGSARRSDRRSGAPGSASAAHPGRRSRPRPTAPPAGRPTHGEDVVARRSSTSPRDRGVRRLEPQDGAGQRRLAAAGLAGDADDLAALDGEVDAAHGRQRRRSPVA